MGHKYAFAPKDVLYRLSWNLVQNYFAKFHPTVIIACLHRNEPDSESLAEAITSLPTEQQSSIEEDLKDLYDLSDEQAVLLIAQEASFEGNDFAAVFSELKTNYDVALWALLNHEELFAKVLRFRTADNLDGRFWRRRRGVPEVTIDGAATIRGRLSRALSEYLVREEGRGHHCEVEYLRRSTGHLFIAYPEDYGETILHYEGDQLVRRTIKPATDLLFFYAPDRGLLEVYCRGSKERVDALQTIFGHAVLGMALPPDTSRGRFYDLKPLIDPDFSFRLDAAFAIEGIFIKSLFLKPKDGGKPISIYPDGPPGMSVLIAAAGYLGIESGGEPGKRSLHDMEVLNARLQASERPLGKRRRGRTKTFSISRAGCALDHEGFQGNIRICLEKSGLEREVPEPSLI